MRSCALDRGWDPSLSASGVSALTDFDQALTLRQVSWLYVGDVVRKVEEIRFV